MTKQADKLLASLGAFSDWQGAPTMAHFAILCPPDAGHIYPLGSLGNELIRRGHRITMISHPRAAPIIGQMNLPLYELQTSHIRYPFVQLLWLPFHLFGAGHNIIMRTGFYWDAKVTLQLLPGILKELAVDGLLMDQIDVAGGTAAERAGLPFVTVCTATPWNEESSLPPPFTLWRYAEGRQAQLRNRLGYACWHWFLRPTIKLINHYRKTWELPPLSRIDDSFSPLAQISQLFPELDFPRSELPQVFHYVGSLAANRPSVDGQFPWDRLDGRPLILASLGTIAEQVNVSVYRKILDACADLPAQLVLGLGNWSEPDNALREKLGEIPDNAIVAGFAPQLALLERAALMITHAGMNSTLESISRAVPMVALPRSADQPGNATRIEYSGAGILASFHRSTPQELRQVIERALSEDAFRKRARELQQAMLAAGGVGRAADIAEEALITRCPVLRQHSPLTLHGN
jgi:zeaxanthin glucosyltransferase